MDLSIIALSYNTKDVLKECLVRVQNSNDKLKKEIIIIDNASNDKSAEMIKKEFPNVILIENKKNVGFARANNQGAKIAKGKYILLLNSDAFIARDTLKKTVRFMEQNPNCGILGCRLVNKNSKLQPSARNFPTPWRLFVSTMGLSNKFSLFKRIDDRNWKGCSIQECDWVPGCYFLVRRKVIDEIGFLDENYFLYYEEVDFCLRAKKNGWKVIFYPETEVIHLGGKSAKRIGKVTLSSHQLEKPKLESEYIYFRKNYGLSYILLDFFLILLFDITEIFKKIIMWRKDIIIKNKLDHILLVYHVLIRTKFGSRLASKINKY